MYNKIFFVAIEKMPVKNICTEPYTKSISSEYNHWYHLGIGGYSTIKYLGDTIKFGVIVVNKYN